MAENEVKVEPSQNGTYDPLLNDPINQRAYTQPNVKVSPERLGGHIPTSDFTQQQIIDSDAAPKENKKPEPPPPVNPELQYLSDSEKEPSAEYLSKFAVDMYAALWEYLGKRLQFSEKKLLQLQQSGTIDFELQILHDPYSNETVSIGEFFKEFNEQNAHVLDVSPKFKEQLIPVLTRIFKKRAIGLTDEQHAVFLIVQDSAPKLFILFQISKQMTTVIDSVTELTATMRRGASYQHTPPPPYQQPPTPTPQPNEPATAFSAPAPSEFEEPEEKNDSSVANEVESILNPDGAAPNQKSNVIQGGKRGPVPGSHWKQTKKRKTKRAKKKGAEDIDEGLVEG